MNGVSEKLIFVKAEGYKRESHPVPPKPDTVHFCWCGKFVEWELVEPLRLGENIYFPNPFWTRGKFCPVHDAADREEKKKNAINAVHPGRESCGLSLEQMGKTFEMFRCPPGWIGIVKVLKNFAMHRDKNIVLCGLHDLGKSHLLCAVVNDIAEHKGKAEYMRFVQLQADFLDFMGGDGGGELTVANYIIRLCKNEGVLALDDVGAERTESEWMKQAVYNLFDNIEVYGKKGVIMTSNWSPRDQEMVDRLGERTTSRINRNFQIISLKGIPWSQRKKEDGDERGGVA